MSTFTLTPAFKSANESAGTVTFTLTRSSSSGSETVYVSTTQTEGFSNSNDYTSILNQVVTFSAGQTSKTITVNLINDAVVESDETFGFIVQAHSTDPASTFLDKSTFTIVNDDSAASTFTLSPASKSVNEGDGAVTFTLTRSSSSGAETVYVSTTQTEGFSNSGDYTGLNGQAVTFSAGQTSKTVTINVTNDSVVEGDETFGLIVQRNSTDSTSTYLDKSTFTIANDDSAASTFTLSPETRSVAENAGTVTFTLTRSSSSGSETVYVSTTQTEGFTNGNDYTGLDGQAVTFSAGQTSKTITVNVTNDSVVEGDETFGLIVQRNSTDSTSTYLDKSTFTIANDDNVAHTSYSVSASPNPVNEGAGTLVFTVSRSGDLPDETVYTSTVNGLTNGYAVNSGDYATNINNLSVHFSAGQTTATVNLAVSNDSASENDETFGLVVQRQTTDPLSTYLAKTNWTIHDDDSAQTSSGYAVSVNQNPVSENSGSITFTITRTNGVAAETVYASTINGSANGYAANVGDYATTLNNYGVNFAAGELTKTVTLAITNDTNTESDETFGLIVQHTADPNVNHYLAKTNWTVHDDDASGATSAYTVTATPDRVTEADGATVSFTITRTGDLSAETLYASTVQDQGAANSHDYASNINNLPVSFAAGEAIKSITLTIDNDGVPENEETFGLLIQRNSSDPTSVSLARTSFVIHDDDSGSVTNYSVSPDVKFVPDIAGTTITFTVTRTGDLPVETIYANTLSDGILNFSNNDGLFQSLSSLPITFAAGAASAKISLNIVGSTLVAGLADIGLALQRDAGAFVNELKLAITNFTVAPIAEAHSGPLVHSSGWQSVIVAGGSESFGFGRTVLWGELNPNANVPNATLTHPAVDIEAPLGTEVDAFADGEVVEATNNEALGYYVRIRHTNVTLPGVPEGQVFYSLYAHLDSHLTVSQGQKIAAGDKIGSIGIGGTEEISSNGNGIVHFEIRLFDGLYHPGEWKTWDLPKEVLSSNIYIYGHPSNTDLYLDPSGDKTGYVNPENFITLNNLVAPVASGNGQSLLGQGASNSLTIAGNGNQGSIYSVSALANECLITDVTTNKLLFSASQFGEVIFKLINNLHIGKVNGTGILGHTIYYVGTDGADYLEATAADTDIVANGGTGDDTLIGGTLNDSLNGGSGLDALWGGAGDDVYTIDNTGDVVTENANEGRDTIISSVNFSMGANLENLVLTGSLGLAGAGNGLDNTLTGTSGNNALFGAQGNDILIGGDGADALSGAEGLDTASYTTALGGVTVFLGGPQLNTGEAAGDTYTSIENLAGGAFADILGGDAGNNKIEGNGGSDWMFGSGGSDYLLGGDGGDVLEGGAGADVLDGGNGPDVASYRNSTAGVVLDLITLGLSAGDAQGDVLVNVENLWGTGFNDTIRSNISGGGQVYGFEGNDILAGSSGNDVFYGGTGADTITTGGGADDIFFLSYNNHVNQYGTPEPYEGGDTITDFQHGIDHITVSRYWFGFGNIGGPAAALTSANADFITAGTTSISTKPTFFWNDATKVLQFDPDGTGAATAVTLATLTGVTLTLSDIWTA